MNLFVAALAFCAAAVQAHKDWPKEAFDEAPALIEKHLSYPETVNVAAHFKQQREKKCTFRKEKPTAPKFCYRWHSDEEHAQWNIVGMQIPTMDCDNSKMVRESCEFADDDDPTSEWQIVRFGPITSSGGDDWHQLLLFDSLFTKSKKKWLSASSIAPLDKDGNIISYPPIHVHHIHAYVGGTSFSDVDRIQANKLLIMKHGDQSCTVEEGGTDCYMEAWPKPWAMLNEGPYWMTSMLQDVRPKDSEEMTWWLEFAIRETDEESMTLSRMGIGIIPQPTEPNGLSPSGTYLVPKGESVYWSTTMIPDSGKILWAYMHTHNKFVVKMWMFHGTCPSLQPFEKLKENPWDTVQVSDMITDGKKHSVDSFIDYILSREKLFCEVAGAHIETVDGKVYDRRQKANCTTLGLEKGEKVTTVSINRAEHGGVNPQHSTFRFIYHNWGKEIGLSLGSSFFMTSYPITSFCRIWGKPRTGHFICQSWWPRSMMAFCPATLLAAVACAAHESVDKVPFDQTMSNSFSRRPHQYPSEFKKLPMVGGTPY